MPTLNIGGQRVKVDDSFMSLSPDEQNATVDEIAGSLSKQPAQDGSQGRSLQSSLGAAAINAAQPIANIPSTYSGMVDQSVDQMKRGVSRMSTGVDEAKAGNYLNAAKELGLGAGGALLGAAGYVGAPINAPIHSIVGAPIANNVEAATGSHTAGEFAGNLADAGTALMLPVPSKVPLPARLPTADDVAAASQRLGVPIPRAAATESIPVKATAGAIAQVPVVGTPLVKASKDALAGLDDAARTAAAGYGEAERFAAGTSAKQGILDWITGTSRDISERLYGKVDKLVDPTVETPLTNTQATVQSIIDSRKNARLPQGKAVDMVSDAVNPGQTLNYDGVKQLRTAVGEVLNGSIIPEGMSQGDLKRIYGSLTKDLQSNVAQAGGQPALDAFNTANNIHAQISARRDALAKIVGKSGEASPEAVLDRVVSMASATRGGDLAKLSQARKAMGVDAWNDVAAAAVNKLGRASPEAEFSGDRFLTQWNNLSDQGKQLLFNSTGKGDLVQTLNDIAALSKAHKSLTQFGNPSGTGRAVTFTGMAGAAWANPVATLSTALGGNVLARVFASPAASSSALKWAIAYDKASRMKSPVTMAALAGSTRNLVNNLSDLGVSIPNVRSLAGQAPASADQSE